MRAALSVALRLLRGGGRRDLQTVGLAVVAYAVSTALLVIILGGLHGFMQRNDRDLAWSAQLTGDSAHATGADDDATPADVPPSAGTVAAHTEPLDGQALTIVDVAAPEDPGAGASALVPPGLDSLPAPGQVWVSPALAKLVQTLPDDQLSGRLLSNTRVDGARLAGEIRADALPTPGYLLAVVGRAPGDPAVDPAAPRGGWNVLAPRGYTAFTDGAGLAPDRSAGLRPLLSSQSGMYLGLAWLAVVLMIVPLVTLGSAAARLGVARRHARLAALRLIGATPGQVVGMTAAESMVHAAVGAVLGVGLSLAFVPLVGLVPFQGSGFGFAELWVGWLWLAAVFVGVVLLAGASAVVGLRRVVVSPLGVAARQTPPGVKVIRLLVFVAVLIAWNAVGASAMKFGVTFILVALGGVFLVVNLIGPWLVAVMARVAARRAKSAGNLLAARRLLDDPKSAWRAISGLALAGFVAAIVSVMPALTASVSSDQVSSTISVPGVPATNSSPDGPGGVDDEGDRDAKPAPAAVALAGRVEERLRGLDLNADVAAEGGTVRVTQTVPESGSGRTAAIDRLVTGLTGVQPGSPVLSGEADEATQGMITGDIQTGVLFTLALTFLIAAASVGIAQASSTLDRRQIYGLMYLAGTDEKVLNAARFKATLWPLLLTCCVSAGLGLFFTAPILGVALVAQPAGLLLLLGCLAAGVVLVLLASAASRPILAQVLRDTTPRPD